MFTYVVITFIMRSSIFSDSTMSDSGRDKEDPVVIKVTSLSHTHQSLAHYHNLLLMVMRLILDHDPSDPRDALRGHRHGSLPVLQGLRRRGRSGW